MIGDAIADNMDDLPLLLKPPPHRDHRSRHDLTPVEFEPVGPEDTVGDSGLVFARYEQDALRGARTLAHKDHAGHFDVSAIADFREIDARSVERRVGKEFVSTFRSRWSPCISTKNTTDFHSVSVLKIT